MQDPVKDFVLLQDINVSEKTVILRADLNIPIKNGTILSDAKLQAALPTLEYLKKQGAKVLILTHLGRPIEGRVDPDLSTEILCEPLNRLLNTKISFKKNWLDDLHLSQCSPGEIILGENVRFEIGEKANDATLAKKMAALCEVFVMDAFAAAHRNHASTVGLADYAKTACGGFLLQSEIEHLTQGLHAQKKPVVGILGGSKVSTKIDLIHALLDKVDVLILGGGLANTFLALEHDLGNSLYESDCKKTAQDIMQQAKNKNISLVLPEDVVVTHKMEPQSKTQIIDFSQQKNLSITDHIGDIGPKTMNTIDAILQTAGTIIWNGPLGIFEWENFSQGTRSLCESIARSQAFSLAGGGETLAAIDAFGIAHKLSYISTGGGAFLEFLQGKKLPGIEALKKRK